MSEGCSNIIDSLFSRFNRQFSTKKYNRDGLVNGSFAGAWAATCDYNLDGVSIHYWRATAPVEPTNDVMSYTITVDGKIIVSK